MKTNKRYCFILLPGLLFAPCSCLQAQQPEFTQAPSDSVESEPSNIQASLPGERTGENIGESTGESIAESAGENAPDSYFEQQASLNQLEQSIISLELNEGIFSSKLPDVLLAAAEIRFEMDQAATAIEIIQTAIQIARANNGLNTPLQNKFIMRLIDHFVATGNQPGVSEWLAKYYRVATEQLEANKPEWSYYYAEMAALALSEKKMALLSLPHDYQDWLGAIAQQQETSLEYVDEAEKINRLRRSEYFNRPSPNRQPGSIRSASGSYYNPEDNDTFGVDTYSDYLDKSYEDGVRYFDLTYMDLKSNQQSTEFERTGAALDLADWHLKFGRYSRARKMYESAYQELVAAGHDPEQVNRAMNSFQLISLNSFGDLNLTNNHHENLPFIEIEFTVTARGKISKFRAVKLKDEHLKDFFEEYKELIRLAQFRPVLKNGKPVTSKMEGYRVYLPPDFPENPEKYESIRL